METEVLSPFALKSNTETRGIMQVPYIVLIHPSGKTTNASVEDTANAPICKGDEAIDEGAVGRFGLYARAIFYLLSYCTIKLTRTLALQKAKEKVNI